ncbi:Protein MgtC [Rhodopseudomonas palustris]|uniref:Protein MgtC n=1 Tax=Rhodopseudomonas palustris (strain ATCC BAA-98 / CGA009) TaxID=258594 RepID=Q6NBG5_RHOPA|nr:MgtC/SapB family protein [Rhodopseudomonas palustris]OPF97483.1 methyltransferase [Rhodopseudomonas palustris]QQM02355.1 Protein MgtC [Rhodopseudomonas palustris]RJF59464.1 MgtC/SapB family protein [Rhodopseudomonas palustris]WAB78551.1 MgtC/SapB family protein [Rhodopseudomonas palustris]WCL90996.1 MgtC/SapB family protein [Rhodopseudomonas palustris CGA009]
MRFLTTFQTADFFDTLVSLAVAFVLGMLIGAERQYRTRTAGLRTNVLVAVGAAAFVDLAMHLAGADGAVRVIAYVVSGIGFLGAGVIMKEGMNVRGLNTAATLWSSAAVGCCAGGDLVAQAVALTVFVIAGNTLLRPLVNAINRIPFDERTSEATYSVRLTADGGAADRLREHIEKRLEQADYPVAEVEVESVEHADDKVEIVATLVSTAVEPNELDAVVAELGKESGVDHATWETSTKD